MKTYGPTMQCNSKTLDYIKCSNVHLALAITYALSLNHHFYHNQTLPQLTNISYMMLTYPLL